MVSQISLRERRVAQVFFLLLAALKVAYLLRFRFDSDEAQHLHVVWGWTRGLLQYRDVFDNHMPLFHLLCAPLLALFPERPDILLIMRAAMLPLFAFSIWCTGKIASALWSPRVGMWAAIFAGLWRGFFFCSTEFRTDDLLTAAWMGALVIAVCGKWSTRRALAFGLALGVCEGVSQKTTLLALTLMLAGLGVFFFAQKGRAQWGALAQRGAAFAAGACVLPAAIAAYFFARGAWTPFLYGVLLHNIVTGVDRKNEPLIWLLFFPATLPCIWLGARWLLRISGEGALARRRVFIFLVAALYFGLLQSYWTLITRQDYLLFHPVAFISITPLLLWLGGKTCAAVRALRPHAAWLAPASVGVVEIALIVLGRPLTVNGTARGIELVRETLLLTGPADTVMDLKGETIYRRRAFYYVLEPFTFVRIHRRIIDEKGIPAAMIENRARVVPTRMERVPQNVSDFIAANYVPVLPPSASAKDPRVLPVLAVAGKKLRENDGAPVKFELPVEGEYVLVPEQKSGAIPLLDGVPFGSARLLKSGTHELAALAPGTAAWVIWNRAIERGFSPKITAP